jgi:hypothetical protein
MVDWLSLFLRAVAIMDSASPGTVPDDWTIGGGTMLYRRYGHRSSRDIDIFLSSPQSLTALSPRLNNEAERQLETPADYVEQSHFLKFAYDDGDVDFIVAPHLLTPFATRENIADRAVWVETSAEILAKKVLYRADEFTARDLFDFALLVGTGDADALLAEPTTYLRPLRAVLRRLDLGRDGLIPAFAQIEALAFRPTFSDCEGIVRAFCESAGA